MKTPHFPSAPAAAPADSTPPIATTATSPPATVQLARWLAVGSLLGLIGLALGWELLWAPLRPGGSWLALKALPLCIPLAGLLRNRMYTYRWVSLVVWLYFIEGVVRAWGDKAPGNYLAMVEVALCLLLFVAVVLHIRVRQRYAKAARALDGADPDKGSAD